MKEIDVIVIGTGMGGLSCGAALAKMGKRVLALEQHYVPGGMTHTFKRKNFIWDVGVHCMGEMDEGRFPRRILDWLSNEQVTMHKYDKVYDSFHFADGLKIDLPIDRDKYFADLVQRFPNEEKGLKAYKKAVELATKSGYGHFFTQLLPNLWAKLLAPILAHSFKRWSQTTTQEVLTKTIKDTRLRTILSAQWGYYGPPPSRSSFYIHAVTTRHFWFGGFYPVGGSKVFSDALVRTIEQSGGQVLTRALVKSVLFEKKQATGVELQNGQIYHAPTIISAIGAKATIDTLLPQAFRSTAWSQSIMKLSQSPCHVALYLGLEGNISEAGAQARNQWFYETYDMEKTTWDVNDANSVAPILYVSFPCLKDPLHKGGQTGEVVTFVPYDAFTKWEQTVKGKRGDEYLQFKQDLEKRLLAQLFKWMPLLKKHVVYCEFSTPLSTVHYCRSPQGAIYGISPTPMRFACKALRPTTPYKNFYLTGSDVGTLGVVGAMIGGVLTAAKLQPKIWGRLRASGAPKR
ncbi:MAG: NAD(P)/FAD-dependent oxidoreductase [Bdellovibrio sp.]|nr:NAD(P)/FAD-dependent oxidoreductase [Bdellovibrio sp.]